MAIRAACGSMLGVMLLAPSTAMALAFGVNIEGEAGRNNRHDTSPASCDVSVGCFTNTGARCADAPSERCELQVVPAGRCTAGTGSCIWPLGAGVCQHDGGLIEVDPVACLTDAYVDFLRFGGPNPGNGDGPSVMCAEVRGGNGICDMSANDPTCDCSGTDQDADPSNLDPDAPSWEGSVCGGSIQAVCSDGDPKRGSGLGTSLCADSECGSTFEGALIGAKYPNREEPRGLFTLHRQPGAGATTPDVGGPVLPIQNTLTIIQDDVGEGDFSTWGVRRLRLFSSGHHFDVGFSASEVTGETDAMRAFFACDVPVGQGWGPDRPVAGACTLNAGLFCVQDSDCGALGPCDPETFRYCHESDGDPDTIEGPGVETTGFLFTRALTPAEVAAVGGQCPPACPTAYDFDTFEMEAIAQAVWSGDTRAGLQIAFDNLEGALATGGRHVVPLPLVLWLAQLGDSRCFIGGQPIS